MRFTIRTIMIAVAIVAVGIASWPYCLGLIIFVVRLYVIVGLISVGQWTLGRYARLRDAGRRPSLLVTPETPKAE